jgi:hypothetical protein
VIDRRRRSHEGGGDADDDDDDGFLDSLDPVLFDALDEMAETSSGICITKETAKMVPAAPQSGQARADSEEQTSSQRCYGAQEIESKRLQALIRRKKAEAQRRLNLKKAQAV